MDIELAPEAGPLEQLAVTRAVAVAALAASGTVSGWWRAGLEDALDRAPGDRPRPAAYEATRPPRSTRGATRA